MKGIAIYAVIAVTTIAILAWLLARALDGPGDADAVRLSAIVVAVVQVAAFAVTKLLTPRGVMVGWGAGALLRFLTLGIYALLVVKVLGLPAVAALLSMAVFFFVTTLIEPLLLRL